MNKPRIHLLKAVLISLSLFLFGCGINFEENFNIEKLWFDSNNIYVLYTKSNAIYHYSPLNINGDLLTKEKITSFIYHIPRASIQSPTQINLEQGSIASSLIYEDHHFKVTGDSKNVTINAGIKFTRISNCSGSIWSAQGVIRSGDKLFYCGAFFDQTGDFIKEVPKSVIDELTKSSIESHPEQRLPSLLPPIFDFAISENELLITSDDISFPSVLKVAIWPLENGEKLNWHNINIPMLTKGFTIANHYNAYAPSGFVLKPNFGQAWVLYCQQLECRRINVGQSYEYLLFDSERRELLIFVRETIGSPLLTVYKSNY